MSSKKQDITILETASGPVRTVVRNVYPNIENGRYAIKRVVGETVDVWADVLADGHDIVCAALQFKHTSQQEWSESRATSIGNDRWHAQFTVEQQGSYQYRFIGWVDDRLYWQYGIGKKADAGVDITVELLEGVIKLKQLTSALSTLTSEDETLVKECIAAFQDNSNLGRAIKFAKSERLTDLFMRHPDRPHLACSELEFEVYVDREKAAFSTWYEFFPRSAAAKAGQHGTFKDCLGLLPRIKDLGFDTLYFPPIHPIGRINRKGRNNSTEAERDDVGSCWGIGAEEGGHRSVHPLLGNLDDFLALIAAAKELDIEIAMDYALQATPDHPWVNEHPEWFRQRPDGSIQYAENPPKKYQDIYPIYFESEDWQNMWREFLDTLLFWIDHGIKIFRVDNPHTKPFGFWEWVISKVKQLHPDVLFLAEAFSRPAVMKELAQLGFSQSYTYFTWRNSKEELSSYMQELTTGPTSETVRPNFWPNTPDILPFALQNANESIYLVRYFLAATLSSNCGVYGPVYEFMINESMSGKEEYLNSEKYEVRHWDWKAENRITDLYRRVNRARKEHKALQRTNNIELLHIDHPQILAYKKTGTDGNIVLCIVNLNPIEAASGYLHIDTGQIKRNGIELNDLITGANYHWNGNAHYIELSADKPFHLFIIS